MVVASPGHGGWLLRGGRDFLCSILELARRLQYHAWPKHLQSLARIAPEPPRRT